MKAIEVLIDSSRGQFIPQHFAQDCTGWDGDRHTLWSIEEHNQRVLEVGPPEEGYWDAWQEVLETSRMVIPEGYVYQLHQTENGDVLAVCLDRMTAREKVDVLGMEPEEAGLKPYTVVGYYQDNDQDFVSNEWAMNAEEAISLSPASVRTIAVFPGHIDEADED